MDLSRGQYRESLGSADWNESTLVKKMQYLIS